MFPVTKTALPFDSATHVLAYPCYVLFFIYQGSSILAILIYMFVIAVFALLILSAFLTDFATNYVVLGVIRFFVGVFCGGTMLVSYVLAQELLGSSVWTITGKSNFVT